MPTEHDEALVERVALALLNARREQTSLPPFTTLGIATYNETWRNQARAVIYPPAPPKTRLQVARELVSEQFRGNTESVKNILSGSWDTDRYMKAVLAALALDKMED